MNYESGLSDPNFLTTNQFILNVVPDLDSHVFALDVKRVDKVVQLRSKHDFEHIYK